MNKSVPYYPNVTGNHCTQSCLKMAFEYLNPNEHWDFEKLDELSGHKPGLTTWMMRTYCECAPLGYDIIVYDPMDYEAFARNPREYLSEKFHPDYAEFNFQHSDMPQAAAEAEVLLKTKDIQRHARSYELDELKHLLDNDFLCLTWVDLALTNGMKDQCIPHFILIFAYDKNGVFAHDPGMDWPESHLPDRHIPWDIFEKANKMNEQGERGEMFALRRKQMRIVP